jgi:predicted lipid-binding transport protein (Tim44 family)
MAKSRNTTPAKAAGQPAREGARRPTTSNKPRPRATAATRPVAPEASPPATSARRSKKAAILALLQQPDGAAIGDLIASTGWQVHSVRAALTGLRKEGKELVRAKDAAGVTHYRVAEASA